MTLHIIYIIFMLCFLIINPAEKYGFHTEEQIS